MSNEKRNASILVVDDDAFICSLVCDIIRNLGYEKIESVSNGLEALMLLEISLEPYSIIVCDLNMPEMDGVEFMQLAAERDYKGSVILLSGEDKRILDIARGVAAANGLDILGSISKPFTKEAFVELLDGGNISFGGAAASDLNLPIDESELHAGLQEMESHLTLCYEPIVHVSSGDIVGVESIPMWRHSTRGLLEPGVFMHLVEENGLLSELMRCFYTKAIQQTKRWLLDGVFLQNYIRIPLELLADAEFSSFVIGETERLGVEQTHMNFVLEDSELEDRSKETFSLLMRLHFKKIGIAIGNFESGLSTLEMINSFPFALLQIHREIISTTGSENGVISVIRDGSDFRNKLAASVAVMGIDSRADWDMAEVMGIDYIQGSFCSKALPNLELLDLIESWSPPPRLTRQKPMESGNAISSGI